jgi:hypothetical protein
MDPKPRNGPDVIPLPVRRSSSGRASRFDVARWRMREWLGRIANRLRLPGAIADTEFVDTVTGQVLSVRVGRLFVVMRVDGREYYFWRFSGRYDGAGSCADANSRVHYSEA